jgi:hypothetical protein
MKKIIIAAAVSAVAIVGCTSQADPSPTVTITEQAPAPNVDDGAITNSQKFVEFVRQNGGTYGEIANESDLIGLGDTICKGFAGGLSEDEITQVLAQALVNNNMGNDAGAKFGAALIVGARTYLCPVTF